MDDYSAEEASMLHTSDTGSLTEDDSDEFEAPSDIGISDDDIAPSHSKSQQVNVTRLKIKVKGGKNMDPETIQRLVAEKMRGLKDVVDLSASGTSTCSISGVSEDSYNKPVTDGKGSDGNKDDKKKSRSHSKSSEKKSKSRGRSKSVSRKTDGETKAEKRERCKSDREQKIRSSISDDSISIDLDKSGRRPSKVTTMKSKTQRRGRSESPRKRSKHIEESTCDKEETKASKSKSIRSKSLAPDSEKYKEKSSSKKNKGDKVRSKSRARRHESSGEDKVRSKSLASAGERTKMKERSRSKSRARKDKDDVQSRSKKE
jgi:hypothetical protein